MRFCAHGQLPQCPCFVQMEAGSGCVRLRTCARQRVTRG